MPRRKVNARSGPQDSRTADAAAAFLELLPEINEATCYRRAYVRSLQLRGSVRLNKQETAEVGPSTVSTTNNDRGSLRWLLKTA